MATIATSTVTLNAAFLQEIKEDNRQLWELVNHLREVFHNKIYLHMPCMKLFHSLAQFRDQLATHFSLEEAYGYFEDPICVAPRISRAADVLRNQHQDLYSQICEIVAVAEDLLYQKHHHHRLTTISKKFSEFDEAFCEHEKRENELIFEAYFDDIGEQD